MPSTVQYVSALIPEFFSHLVSFFQTGSIFVLCCFLISIYVFRLFFFLIREV